MQTLKYTRSSFCGNLSSTYRVVWIICVVWLWQLINLSFCAIVGATNISSEFHEKLLPLVTDYEYFEGVVDFKFASFSSMVALIHIYIYIYIYSELYGIPQIII
ncbi:hypothetical protein PRUPE_4G163900 [Prunus persica]|uniref:Uncharacterized protein n=1 Tax=Prunus persica TaxID=3760 RepID=A0A251PLK9_PRUPE|nr:hypothetical protein PRUPE_4G163900 [Prunus persica]